MNFIFDPSLVFYLPLYLLGGSSFMSRDKHGHLCTVTGAVWRPYGHYFDGSDDRVSVPDHASLQTLDGIGAAYTVEFWMRTTQVGGGAIFTSAKQQVSRRNAGATTNVPFFFGVTDLNKQLFGVRTEADGTGDRCISGVDVNDDNWHHIVGVKKPTSPTQSSLYLYVDIVLEAQATTTLDASVASGQTNLGCRLTDAGVPDELFNGYLGEVRFYGRALTSLEIQHNYLATKWRYR